MKEKITISGLERSKLHAQDLLNKVIPFKAWCKIEPRSKLEKKAYRLIVKELKKIAKEGWQEEIQ